MEKLCNYLQCVWGMDELASPSGSDEDDDSLSSSGSDED